MNIRAFIDRYYLRPAHYLFAAVVLVRVIALVHLSASPFLLPSAGDMHFYDSWAQRILRGEMASHLAFYGLPGYAYLLALIYKICGYGPFVPGLIQALLDAGTAVLIYRLTSLVLAADTRARSTTATQAREVIAWLAGLAWAFFVPAQAYSVILMPTAWVVFVFWLIVWRVVEKKQAPAARESLLLGLLIGVTATAVATILFLIPLIIAAVFAKPRKIDNRKRGILAAILALLLGISAGTSPCWIHNYFIARDPVFLSAHSGINLWIGNNPDANGYPKFPPGLRAGQAAMLEDSIRAAESAAGHPLKRADVSRFWSAKANDYVAGHFSDWLRLLARKFRNFWSAFQYDDLSIITVLHDEGVIFPGIYFGLVAALAFPGMVLQWRNSAARWIALAILLQLCALLPVFVTERYRLPIVPGLLVFAATGLSILYESITHPKKRTAFTYFALLLAATLFVSWPQRDRALWALDAYNSGRQALESNNYAAAERKLLLAYAYVPDNAETNFALGNLHLAQKQPDAASAFYRETLHFDPHHKGALNNLGVIALEARDLPAARLYFTSALAQDRHDAKTLFLLAKTAAAQGDLATAQRAISEALKIAPTQREFLELEKELAAHRQ
ncbi:MAG: hypothetical protein QOG48_406 [Verrucomicrobiota bacterium]